METFLFYPTWPPTFPASPSCLLASVSLSPSICPAYQMMFIDITFTLLESSVLYSLQSAAFRNLWWESKSLHATQVGYSGWFQESKCTVSSFGWILTETVFSPQDGYVPEEFFLSPQLPIMYILKYFNAKYSTNGIDLWFLNMKGCPGCN